MRYGSPYASGYGSYDNMVKYLRYDRSRLAASGRIYLLFMMRSGWGGANVYAGVYINNTLIANVNVPDNTEISVPLPSLPFSTKAVVQILRLGHYGDPGYSIARVSRISEAGDSARVTAQWKWKAIAVGADKDGGFTSAWSLLGCTRANTTGVLGERSWGQLQLEILVSGGNVTINLYNRGGLVASGTTTTGALPTTVTLAAQNGSGISGTFTLAAGVTAFSAGVVYVKWPKSMNILRGASNPPTVVVGTVLYNRKDSADWTEAADLAAGNYYYELQSVSDDNIVGGATSAWLETVNGPPVAPSGLAFLSGSAGAGITLSFNPSITAGVTYRGYAGTPGAQMDMGAPAATAIAGSSQIFIPAAALAGGAGLYCFAVRAISATGGYEEKNIDMLLLSVSGGGVVQAVLPNQPAMVLNSVSITGRAVTVRVTYATADEQGVATQIQLFARNPLGAYVLASPVATATLAATSSGVKSATLSYTFPSDQIVFLAAAALTAGGAQGPISAEIGPYNPSTAATQPAPDDYKFSVARG